MAPGGLHPLGSLAGLGLGLVLLLPLYAVGGMGAGDVKLLAGLGAWVGPALVWPAFLVSVLIGAALALALMARSGRFFQHIYRMGVIASEWVMLRNPVALSQIAEARKSRMCLLPYGVPIAIGTISFFGVSGLLF
jgi:prepilin peptidase CpaA